MSRTIVAAFLVCLLVGAGVVAAARATLGNAALSESVQRALDEQTAEEAVLETIRHRRTVRRYQRTPVPLEDLMKILEAAHFAPTAGNQQPWKFLVVQDRARLDELEKQALEWYMVRFASTPNSRGHDLDSVSAGVASILNGALSAPVYVAVLVDTEAPYPDYAQYDGTLAAGNLMIAARAMGYGTGFFTTFFPEEHMREFFEIPNRYSLVCFTPIGVPEEWPQMPSKKEMEELVVFETYHK